MPRVRLFAGLRQAAGTSEVSIPGVTVGEVLEAAASAYGPDFARGLETANVWVNGQPAEPGTPVADVDEVAVLPPVSGGSTDVRPGHEHEAVEVTTGANGRTPLLPLIAWAALLAANLASEEWFAVVLVGVAGAWAWDAFDEAARRDRGMVRWPALAAIVGVVWAVWEWSSEGLGVAAGLSVLLVLTWAVLWPAMHTISAAGGTLMTSLAVTLSVGSAVLVRLGADGESRITALLVMLLVANIVMWLRLGTQEAGLLDPHTAAALAAVIVGAVAGVIGDTSLLAMVIAAAAVAAAFLAGRALGSALRTGDLYLLEDLPGFLVVLDSALLAAPVYWVVLALVA